MAGGWGDEVTLELSEMGGKVDHRAEGTGKTTKGGDPMPGLFTIRAGEAAQMPVRSVGDAA